MVLVDLDELNGMVSLLEAYEAKAFDEKVVANAALECVEEKEKEKEKEKELVEDNILGSGKCYYVDVASLETHYTV